MVFKIDLQEKLILQIHLNNRENQLRTLKFNFFYLRLLFGGLGWCGCCLIPFCVNGNLNCFITQSEFRCVHIRYDGQRTSSYRCGTHRNTVNSFYRRVNIFEFSLGKKNRLQRLHAHLSKL